jgi:hypothetical protein
LRAEHLVASVPGIVVLGDSFFALEGHGEEFLGGVHDGFLLGEVDPVVLDLEEAIVEAAFADLVYDCLL